jgi:hypothetical protein
MQLAVALRTFCSGAASLPSLPDSNRLLLWAVLTGHGGSCNAIIVLHAAKRSAPSTLKTAFFKAIVGLESSAVLQEGARDCSARLLL